MSKLTKYASEAAFMNIHLEVDGKVYSFNLDQQLMIQETKLALDLKEQPRGYAFLCMLRNKVGQQLKKKQKEYERKSGSAYTKLALTMGKVTDIKQKLKSNLTLRAMEDELEELENLKSVLGIAVTSFEQRKDLLQTLSSNLRIENKNQN